MSTFKLNTNAFRGQGPTANNWDWSSGLAQGISQLGAGVARGHDARMDILKQDKQEANDTFQPVIDKDDPPELQTIKRAAASQIANQAAELARMQRKDGDSEAYKEGIADLHRQLSQVNAGDAYLGGTTVEFDKFQQDPSKMSKATSPQALAVMKAIKDRTITYEYDEKQGKVVYSGTYIDENGDQRDIEKIPTGQENLFPRVVQKVDNPITALEGNLSDIKKLYHDRAMADGSNPALVQEGVSWDNPAVQQSMQNKIKEALADDNALLSTASDYLGIDNAYDLLERGRLRDTVEFKMMQEAEKMVNGLPVSESLNPEWQAKQKMAAEGRAQEAHELRMDQAEKSNSGANGGLTANKLHDVSAEAERKKQDTELFNTALTANEDGELENIQGLAGKGNIQFAEFDKNWRGKGGTLSIQVKGQDDPLEFEVGNDGKIPLAAKQAIFNQLQLGTVQGADETAAQKIARLSGKK